MVFVRSDFLIHISWKSFLLSFLSAMGLKFFYKERKKGKIFQGRGAAFELFFETHFAINMPSAARLLVCCRRKFFLRIEK